MKKLVITTLIFAFIVLLSPNQSYAAWWNPLSWFSRDKETQVQEQKPTQETAPISEPRTQDTDNSKTIEELRAEVATLKASLDNLYAAHTNLVNDHNALLEYTKTIAASNKSAGVT